MVLLEVLYLLRKEYDLRLWVAHYDHRLRSRSLEDALWVYREAQQRGLPFIYGVAPVREYARREKLSLEMAGRELRYRFFENLRSRWDLQKIALAHHADDLAEEVLLKFIRGAGRRGLAGIPIKREAHIIRPLLLVSREEIENFARERKLGWLEDESNQDLRFLRNRVRHLLLPFLEKHFHTGVRENLKRTALILAEEEELIEEMARTVFIRAREFRPELTLKVPVLREVPPALRRRVFWLALREIGVPLFRVRQIHLEAIENLVSGRAHGPVPLPGEFQAMRGPGILRFGPQPRRCPFFQLEISGPGRYPLSEEEEIVVEISRDCPSPGVKLSLDKVSFPFILRNRRAGDRIFWPPVKGHKKIKKFFWEKGLTLEEREKVPLIEYKGRIIAVLGYYVHPDYQAPPEETGLCVSLRKIA